MLKGARGMREHLIEDALDGRRVPQRLARGAAGAHPRRAPVLAEESDPTLRAMVKTYADQLSSKLIVRGQPLASLRELEVAVEQAVLAGAGPRRRTPRRRTP